MSKVLESYLGNLKYLISALTLLGVLYLCYKQSGLYVSLTRKTFPISKTYKLSQRISYSPDFPLTTNTKRAAYLPKLPLTTNLKPRTKEDKINELMNRSLVNIPAQTADSPFDDLRLSLNTYEIPTIVQEPRMSPDGHIIDSIERFRPHMKLV